MVVKYDSFQVYFALRSVARSREVFLTTKIHIMWQTCKSLIQTREKGTCGDPM